MVTHNLPLQVTSFIGREREIAELSVLLNQPTCRLLTLVGPGGIGKTRLATEVAARLSPAFSDGIIFVPLAPISTSENIPTAIASALNINLDAKANAGTQILSYLHDKTLLLVLDNFEHLTDGAAFVADILRAAPNVHILATSREPLNLQDEWLWQVKGLPFPINENSAQFDDYDAVQLFRERARRVRYDFDIQAQASDVIRICALVEGMPLGVELAASWLKTLSCKQIGDEIQRNLDILVSPVRDAPSRHRSIRAVFDHSWNLLTEEQRSVFQRLSVFQGGFTLAAAEKVAGASLWTLAELVDKSLLYVDSNGRYDIHELLRQYGQEKLATAEDMDSTQDAHSAYFLDFLAERLPDVKGRRQRDAMYEIDADFENIRVAWLRGVDTKNISSLDGALDTLYFFVNDLSTQYRLIFSQVMLQYALDFLAPSENHMMYRLWWRVRARYFGHRALFPLLPLVECLDVARAENDPAEIAFCLEWIGFSLFDQKGDATAAQAKLAEAVEGYRALHDPYNLAWSLYSMGLAARYNGDADKARRAFQESLEIRKEIGDRIGQAWADLMFHSTGDYDGEVNETHERVYRFFKEMNFYAGISHIQATQSMHMLLDGNFTAARSHAEEGISLAKKHNYPSPAGGNLLTLARLACIEGHYQQAKQLCEESRRLSDNNPILEFQAQAAEAMTNFGLENYDTARRLHDTALKQFLLQYSKRSMLSLLPVSAFLAAHEGQAIWACEILALTFCHPNAKTGWLHKWNLIGQLRSDLEGKLGAESFTVAWKRGAKLDLEDTVRRILGEEFSPPPLIPSQQLPEALTKRELEILRLIADGLQNQEIADELFIALGTVKTHINAIFSKLDATNRTQAVTRARELALLP